MIREAISKDQHVFIFLVVVSLLIRIPFLKAFDLVAYDGTYYINEAISFINPHHPSGAFPIGYPAFIAVLLPIVRDGVRAAQAVSLLASLGTLMIFYVIARQLVRKELAWSAAIILALTPLFIRLSLMTLSESLFIFWVLLGFLFFIKNRGVGMRISMGFATITRPEALGIFAVLAFLKRKQINRFPLILLSFFLIYSVNAVVLSIKLDRIVVLPKSGLLGTSAENWKRREAWVEFTEKEKIAEELQQNGETSTTNNYISRLPGEIILLGRHVPWL